MKTVFLLGGKIGSGKNFVFEMMKKEFERRGKKCEHIYFAKALKDMSRDAFKPLANHMNELAKKALDDGDLELAEKLRIEDENWYENKTDITRMIIQAVGTDFVRRVDPDFWVKQAAIAIQSSEADCFFVTDFRFPNEYYSLKDMLPGAKIIPVKIDRKIERGGIVHQHASELALDDFKHFEVIIDNNGTPKETEEKIKAFAASM